MIQSQVSAKFLALIEAAMRAGALATPSLGLLTNNPFAPTVNTLLADLTQPTFTGYAVAPLTLGALRSNSNGDLMDPYASVTFQPTVAPGSPVTVTGAFLQATITAVDYLLQTTMLPTPFVFAATTDALDLVPEVVFPNLQVYGGICTTCP